MIDYFQKINCIPCLTQIMELQFKYPGLWLVNANLNNGISTQISLILRIKTQITELQFKYPVTEWNGVEHVVMNIDESVFRMPIYSVQAIYIVMNIDESMKTNTFKNEKVCSCADMPHHEEHVHTPWCYVRDCVRKHIFTLCMHISWYYRLTNSSIETQLHVHYDYVFRTIFMTTNA